MWICSPVYFWCCQAVIGNAQRKCIFTSRNALQLCLVFIEQISMKTRQIHTSKMRAIWDGYIRCRRLKGSFELYRKKRFLKYQKSSGSNIRALRQYNMFNLSAKRNFGSCKGWTLHSLQFLKAALTIVSSCHMNLRKDGFCLTAVADSGYVMPKGPFCRQNQNDGQHHCTSYSRPCASNAEYKASSATKKGKSVLPCVSHWSRIWTKEKDVGRLYKPSPCYMSLTANRTFILWKG